MVDPQIEKALSALWQLPQPGPENLLAAPAFVALSELCDARFGGGKAVFGLSSALRSLGLPCGLPAKQANLALDLPAAAEALQEAFTRKTALRRHLCPLDLADDLPPLTFGRSRVAQFSAEELEAMFGPSKLARNFPTVPLEVDRLSQLHWLVVEEEIELDPRPEVRAASFMFIDLSKDFGEIEPHLGRFPPSVEAALFFLLLAPWEDWSTMPEVDWRGFRIPWIYTVDEDLFVRPARPPSADGLTFEPWFVQDSWGDEIELERPTTLRLDDDAVAGLQFLTNKAWTELEAARATSLFETPIVHFLVRAFLADGMDEVMAHMTAIEAAVGLEADHRRKLRPKPDPHPKLSATERVATRLGAALADAGAIKDYRDLFEFRSAFVHGRAGLQKISTPQRVLARSLARRVARAVVSLASQSGRLRGEVMAELLDRGISFRSD